METKDRVLPFIPAEPVNYDAFLFAPVDAGLWRQHELWDGTYALSDLLDAHEMMAVRYENERRMAAHERGIG